MSRVYGGGEPTSSSSEDDVIFGWRCSDVRDGEQRWRSWRADHPTTAPIGQSDASSPGLRRDPKITTRPVHQEGRSGRTLVLLCPSVECVACAVAVAHVASIFSSPSHPCLIQVLGCYVCLSWNLCARSWVYDTPNLPLQFDVECGHGVDARLLYTTVGCPRFP